ncbi:MAG: hypothetical protein WD734_05650 [Dehalococcoidia bacterium]
MAEEVVAGEMYTLGRWLVRAGREQEFIEAWLALGVHFRSLPRPPGEGTLVQSDQDPRLFYSFGPWDSADDIAAMRADPGTMPAVGRLTALCEESAPGAFRLVARS